MTSRQVFTRTSKSSPLKENMSINEDVEASNSAATGARSYQDKMAKAYPVSYLKGRPEMPIDHEIFRTALEHFVKGAQMIEDIFGDNFETAKKLCDEVVLPYDNTGIVNLTGIYRNKDLAAIVDQSVADRLVWPKVADEATRLHQARSQFGSKHTTHQEKAAKGHAEVKDPSGYEQTDGQLDVLDAALNVLTLPKHLASGKAPVDSDAEDMEVDMGDDLEKALHGLH